MFALDDSYPTPFHRTTTIRYAPPQKSHMMLSVCSTFSQLVAMLVSGTQDAAYPEFTFDSASMAGGVYFCHKAPSGFLETKKSLVMR